VNYLLIFLAGIFAGFVNVMAGGGSMITIPALTLLGMGIDVANGTNRIGILLQNIIATRNFRMGRVLDIRRAVFLTIPTTLGAVLGTTLVVQLNRSILRSIVGIIFLVMSVFILWKPKTLLEGKERKVNNSVSFGIFFLVGIYGGFIQAGVGFLLMFALVLAEGYDLVKTNAIKVFIVMCYTIVSLLIFAFNNKVDYVAGLVLALGTMSGAYVSSKLALKRGAKFVRYVLFIMVVTSAIRYLLIR